MTFRALDDLASAADAAAKAWPVGNSKIAKIASEECFLFF